MRISGTILLLSALVLFPASAFAQTVEERLNKLEETLKNQQQIIGQQQKIIEQLQNAAHEGPSAAIREGTPAKQTGPSEQEQIHDLNKKVEKVVEAQRKVLPSEFNPAIGLVGETIFSYNSQNSSHTGSDRPGGWDVFQRSVELDASASVDPFAKAYVVINGSADASTGESNLEVEEAAIQTDALPWNLTLKAGRFFGEFGRLSYIHDHELPFVNRPLALDQYVGGESRTDGVQLNWLVPTERYVSLTVGAGDQFGGDNPPNYVDGFRNGSGLNYWGRLSTYFELTPDISFEPGISALWNPHTKAQWDSDVEPLPTVDENTYTERERRLLDLDMELSYKPLRNNQFKSLTWGTELLYSNNRYDVTDPSGSKVSDQSVGSLGLYSYLAYKFHRQWTTGFLFDFLEDYVDEHAKTYAYSPYITWALSHWDFLRLQYTYTDYNDAAEAAGLRANHAIYLQWAWIIGSHSHGWQQR